MGNLSKFLMIFFLFGIMFIPAQAITPEQVKTFIENNGWLGEHIEYVAVGQWHHSDLWINTSKLSEDYTVNFKNYLKVHDVLREQILDAIDMGVKIDVMVYNVEGEPLTGWVKVPIEATIKKDRVYRLRFSWLRTDNEYYDWVLFDILKWAAWSPTTVHYHYPLVNDSIISEIINMTFEPLDSSFYNSSIAIKWTNGTLISLFEMLGNNRTYDDEYFGGYSDGSPVQDQNYSFIFNTTNVVTFGSIESPVTSYGLTNGMSLGYYGYAGALDKDAYMCQNGNHSTGFNYTGLKPNTHYRVLASYHCLSAIANRWWYSFDNITYYDCGNIHGGGNWVSWGVWKELQADWTSGADGVFQFYINTFNDTEKSACNDAGIWDGLMFEEIVYGNTLKTNRTYFDFNTRDYDNGKYILEWRAYNFTGHENITQWHINILNDPLSPSCEIATVSNNHYIMNFTKLVTSDPALNMSYYIIEYEWLNSTLYNGTLTAFNDGGWINETGFEIEEDYGTHYFRVWANDTTDAWVYCARDSYTTSETGGGLTTEQNATIYAIFSNTDFTSLAAVIALCCITALFAMLSVSLDPEKHSALKLLFFIMTEGFGTILAGVISEIYDTVLTSTVVQVMVWILILTIAIISIQIMWIIINKLNELYKKNIGLVDGE